MSRRDETSTLVYSTETSGTCAGCGKSQRKCRCRTAPRPELPSDGVVRVGRETKGRKGKGVTVISGLGVSSAELKALAKALKTKCGTGGTVKSAVIEIQGDHRDLVVEELHARGFKTKRSGG